MKRYTSKFKDAYCIDAKDVHLIDGKLVGEPIDRMAEYEDHEKQGLLLRLPVAVKQEVYRINRGAKEPIIPMIVINITYGVALIDSPATFLITTYDRKDENTVWYIEEDIGNKIFLTREEAEKSLEKMKGEEQ